MCASSKAIGASEGEQMNLYIRPVINLTVRCVAYLHADHDQIHPIRPRPLIITLNSTQHIDTDSHALDKP